MSKKIDISPIGIKNYLSCNLRSRPAPEKVIKQLALDRDRLLSINAKITMDAERFYEVLEEVRLFLSDSKLRRWTYMESNEFHQDRQTFLEKIEDAIGAARDGEG